MMTGRSRRSCFGNYQGRCWDRRTYLNIACSMARQGGKRSGTITSAAKGTTATYLDGVEESYLFVSLDKLLTDFEADVVALQAREE